MALTMHVPEVPHIGSSDGMLEAITCPVDLG